MTGPRRILTAFDQLIKKSSTSTTEHGTIVPNQIVQGPEATTIREEYDELFRAASRMGPSYDSLILANLRSTSEKSQALTLKKSDLSPPLVRP